MNASLATRQAKREEAPPYYTNSLGLPCAVPPGTKTCN